MNIDRRFGVLRQTSWRSFRILLRGLFAVESRIQRKFAPKEDKPKVPGKSTM